MIITVTMNPAIDKTVDMEKFEHGGLNRIKSVTIDAGGKGINVSKTIKELGGESIATGFLGGSNGAAIQKMLDNDGITTDFIQIDAETRVNTKVVEANGCVTELNESGANITYEKQIELLNKLSQYANEDTWFVLSGSVPSGMQKDVYRQITEYMHEKGAKVLVDAEGELFVNALEAKPDIVKPNKVELEKYIGATISDKKELLQVGESLLAKGVGIVIISLGEKGAYFLSKETTLYCHGLKVPVHSTVGAGDAMVAAFAYGICQNYSFEECAKLAIATSAGAVSTIGTRPPALDEVKKFLDKVVIEKC